MTFIWDLCFVCNNDWVLLSANVYNRLWPLWEFIAIYSVPSGKIHELRTDLKIQTFNKFGVNAILQTLLHICWCIMQILNWFF